MNTVKTRKPRPYRGKYPNRIRQMESMSSLSNLLVTTNNGRQYVIHAVDTLGATPKLNDEISQWPAHFYSKGTTGTLIFGRKRQVRRIPLPS